MRYRLDHGQHGKWRQCPDRRPLGIMRGHPGATESFVNLAWAVVRRSFFERRLEARCWKGSTREAPEIDRTSGLEACVAAAH
jgi:hypothetical protein